MVVNASSDDNGADIKYTFQRKAGRSLIERCPVFSPDGESLAVIVENVVRVYNLQTSDCVRTLETERPVDELIAIEFPENDSYNLYGCSDTGCVTIWTWENGAVLRETYLKIPYNMKFATFNMINNNDCFITAGLPQKPLYCATFSVHTGVMLCFYPECRPWYNELVRVSLGWCNGDRFAAIVNGMKSLTIQNLFHAHVKSLIRAANNYRIVAVAAHHKESAVAITDTFGRATLVRGNLFDHNSVAKEILHWHYLPPLAVCFSLQGNYFYTGGMEKVLVKWTIGNLAYKANEKGFIPRLPGIVRFINTNNSHIAITLTNNSIVIANAQMKVVSTIVECGGLSPVVRALGGALVHHDRLGALLLAGRTGHLQLYSTTARKVLYNLDITDMNDIPCERWNLLPLETEVTCAAISANGAWLVTSEYRNDGNNYPEEKLKFWYMYARNASRCHLNTCVNLSHGGCQVVALALNFTGEICVSAGTDEKFRIWRTERVNPKKRKVSWICVTACYYSSGIAQSLSHGDLNNFKHSDVIQTERYECPFLTETTEDDIVKKIFNIHKENTLFDPKLLETGIQKNDESAMGGVAISQDGSLIAAWFGCKLTLWDTHLCTLRTSLSHPALRPKGVQVQFGNKDAAHYLVCTTEKCVGVWSLLSLTLKWIVYIYPTCLSAHLHSNKMAIVTATNDVYVFSPHSSKPILVKKRLLDPKTGVIKQCTFGKSVGDEIRLYLMRNDSEIYCIEPEDTQEHRLEVISRRNLPASNFSALLAEQRLSEVRPAGPADLDKLNVHALAGSAIAQFSSAAPHMVPPVSLLCTSFLQHISGQELPEQNEDKQEDTVMEVEEQSSEDEDGDNSKMNGPYAPKVTELWIPNYEAVKVKKIDKIMKEPFLDLHSTSSMFGV